MPLWDKDDAVVDQSILDFCAGEDRVLDRRLLPYDIAASRAHVQGLVNIKLLTAEEGGRLDAALASLVGTLEISATDEDGHSAIERVLTERLGDLGKKVHTGRSRNDQVLVAQRLYCRAALDDIIDKVSACVSVALSRAEETKGDLMPGYTHLQRAVPSTVGFWFAGHAESFLEDMEMLLSARALVDKNPLGTAAGYGVNLDLDREHTTRALGFSAILYNGLCAQNGRGKIEAQVLSALLGFLSTTRRLAWDLSIFTTSEFSLVRLPKRFCTGSSIMPNKHNPDTVEILRAAFAEVAAMHSQLLHSGGLPSGYQRDMQVTKGPLIRALEKTAQAASVTAALLDGLAFNSEACLAAIDVGMLSTDVAIEAAKAGVPFRDAYKRAANYDSDVDVAAKARASIAARTSLGGPGQLALSALRARHEEVRR